MCRWAACAANMNPFAVESRAASHSCSDTSAAATGSNPAEGQYTTTSSPPSSATAESTSAAICAGLPASAANAALRTPSAVISARVASAAWALDR